MSICQWKEWKIDQRHSTKQAMFQQLRRTARSLQNQTSLPKTGMSFLHRRPAESRETRLRRLVYQSSYTGMKETDLLLGRFAKLHLHGLTDEELGQYEALLDAGDDRIYAWVVAGEPAPKVHENRVLELIKEFKND